MEPQALNRILRFGPFRLDVRARELKRGDESVPITPRLLDTLLMLAENHGKVVEKSELMQAVWPEVSVSESNLTQTIYMIRKLLGEQSNGNRYIATVPGRGYSFVAAVSEEIEETCGTSSRRHPSNGIFRTAIIVVAAATAIAIVIASHPFRSGEPAWNVRPLTTSVGSEIGPSFSPDGKQVVYAGSDPLESDYDLFIKDIETGRVRQLTKALDRDWSPAWSPDGATIAFHRAGAAGDEAVWMIPAAGGEPRRIARTGPLDFRGYSRRVVAWQPGGNGLVLSDRANSDSPHALFHLSLDGRRRRLTHPPSMTIGDTDPAVSPDGKWIAFARVTSGGVSDLFVLPATGGEPRLLSSGLGRIGGLAWTADGDRVIYTSTQGGGSMLHEIAFSGGRPKRLPSFQNFVLEPAISSVGSRLAYRSLLQIKAIRRIQLHDGKAEWDVVRSSTQWVSGPQISPDGQRIAYSSLDSGSSEIWSCAFDGSDTRRLTHFNGPLTGSPRWSHDGGFIAFDARPQNNVDIFVIPSKGGNPQRITSHPAEDAVPSWSRDGRWIYFASNRGDTWQVWKTRFEKGAPPGKAVPVTSEGGFLAQESHDREWVYFAKGRHEPGLWRTGRGTTELVTDRLVAGGWGWWYLTSKGVYYIEQVTAAGPAPGYIRFLNLASGRTDTVAAVPKLPFRGVPALSVAPTGTAFVFPVMERSTSDLTLVESFK